MTSSLSHLWNLLPLSLLWLACAAVLYRLGRNIHLPKAAIRGFVRSDDGASYSLNLALVTPLYALMICFLIEITLMLNVQIGVDYAAFTAARSAIVWLPAEITQRNTAEQMPAMVHLAAAQALTPYASSLESNQRNDGASGGDGEQPYFEAYGQTAESGSQTQEYVGRKRRYAMAATSISMKPSWEEILSTQDSGPQLVDVTVKYEMPFNVPGVGKILGRRSSSGPGYVRDLTATVTLELERPKSGDGTLGWDYDSRPAGAAIPIGGGEATVQPNDSGFTETDDTIDNDQHIENLLELIADTTMELERERDPDRIAALNDRLQDNKIALEEAVLGHSPTLESRFDEDSESIPPSNKMEKRYRGFSITGKVAIGIIEVSATRAYLYDCETGEFHRYVGFGGAGGVGAFAGFVVRPLEDDLVHPSDFESLNLEVTGTAALGVGGEVAGGGSVNSDFDDPELNGNTGVTAGYGAGVSAGVSFLAYRGTEKDPKEQKRLRAIQHSLWKGTSCSGP